MKNPSKRLFSASSKRTLKYLIIKFLLKNIGSRYCTGYLGISVDNVEDFVKKTNTDIKVHKIIEENKHLTKEPLNFNEAYSCSIQPLIATTKTVVMDIKDTNFHLCNNHLLDKNRNVIYEPELILKNLPISTQVLSKVAKTEGTVAYLSNTEPWNYYHWMCLTLPFIGIYKKFLNLEEIDYFYVGEQKLTNFQKETLAKAGISMKQVLQEACTADRLVVAISQRIKQAGHKPIAQDTYLFIRSLFQNELKTTGNHKKHRIYVERGNVARRRVIDEDKIIDMLKSYGFEPVSMDGKTVQEQVEIFSQAEAIVAPHGAALTNLLFIQPKVKVIELLPYGYTTNLYYAMASYGKADYFCLQGERTDGNKRRNELDIAIDSQKLEKICNNAFLTS
jgi:hypothetical protein